MSLKSLSSIFNEVDFLSLVKKWPDLVGDNHAKHTIPLGIRNKTLRILSNHSAFSSSLSFMEEKLKEKIFQEFPAYKSKIKKLSFEVNSSYFDQKSQERKRLLGTSRPPPKKELHPQSPKFKLLKKEADHLFKDIENQKLHQTLTSIFMNSKA